MEKIQAIGTTEIVPARNGVVRGWQRWAPYAAVGWSLIYGLLGVYWAIRGGGFPFTSAAASDALGPLMGRFGPVVAWVVVVLAGLPAAVLGIVMLRGVRGRVLQPLFVTMSLLLGGVLLLLMPSLDLLVMVGYIPYTLAHLFSRPDFARSVLQAWMQWSTLHQLLCLLGGFLWLGATVVYARRSGEACLVCGRRDGPEGWTGQRQAARWGRIAVVVGLVPPVFYAFTRYAWALGWPLGMTEAYWRQGQERGTWISGLFLATFGLVGAALMLGLVQRWGERFPHWMPGLAGRRVPLALAIVPAALVSVLLMVGGVGIGSDLSLMRANMLAAGATPAEIPGALLFQVGPTLLFPLWGVALTVATLGYYFRRRGPCKVCGRGATLS